MHISGIGRKTEARFWAAGINSPAEVSLADLPGLSAAKLRLVRAARDTTPPLAQQRPDYWATRLPARELWRLFPQFRPTTAYLDIETTGYHAHNTITTIALYDGVSVHTFVRGENLEDFGRLIGNYEVIVTYNGKGFDVPVIERELGLKLDQAHLDLRPLLASLGFSGGLKGCEKMLGLDRGELNGVGGWDAVLLWREYQRTNDRQALYTLLAYNVADAINLEPLMVEVYNRNVAQTPFGDTLLLPAPHAAANPFQADPRLLARIQARQQASYP